MSKLPVVGSSRKSKCQTTVASWLGVVKPTPSVPDGGYLVVDLFCSVGGVSVAAAALGHRVVLAIDFDPERLAVHECNHPHAKHVCMVLGVDNEEEVVRLIEEYVPENQRHRLWLHLSPPCQSQSSARYMGKHKSTNAKKCTKDDVKEDMKQYKGIGLSLVDWSLHMVVRHNPAQFSIEEVADTQGSVLKIMHDYKLKYPKLIDYDVFKMIDYGVPQTRERAIVARPETIYMLRHASELKVARPVGVSDVLKVPEGAVYFQGSMSHVVNPEAVIARKRPHSKAFEDTSGVYTDGFVDLRLPHMPSKTIGSVALSWKDVEFKRIRCFTPEEMRCVATFPADFKWPANASKKLMYDGYGNAVPPLFVQKLILAANLRARI
jgi:site-specific DNA-cytosine methylase